MKHRIAIIGLGGKEERLIKLPEVARVMKLMEAIRSSAERKQVICLEQ